MENQIENFVEFTGTQEDFEKLISEDRVTIVDFWAQWCGPCRVQLPILKELSEENSDITILKVNVDEQGDIASKYGIRSIPTLMFFKAGKMEHKTVGVNKKDALLEIKNNIQ